MALQPTQQTNGFDLAQISQAAAAPFSLDNSFASYMRSFDPASVFGSSAEFYKNMFEIAVGSSSIAPDAKDWRFQHTAWKDNPFYLRLAQTYLAIAEATEGMIPEDLPPGEKTRAQLITSILTSALAPTNTLLGNPAALEKTIATGGDNLARGFKAFLKDLDENGGMPRQVDNSTFEVGRNLAVTPGKVVHRTDMFELIQYKPATETVHEIPVLLTPPQIGRFYFTDLAPGRSFAEYVVSQGLQYFAISWRNPSAEHSDWGLEAYVSAVLEAVDAIASITGQPKVNVVGFCAGGILGSIVSAYLAAKGRDTINSFTLCVTMLDFEVDASMGAFRMPGLLAMARSQSASKGVLPGTDLHKVFTWLRPNDLVWNYWVNNYLMGEEPAAFDILAWNNDSSNMAAQLHEDFLTLFEENALVAGNYKMIGEPIDLAAITCDSFVVGAVTDHLTPWKACYHSRSSLGGECTFALSNGGHVAALVNPPKNPKAFHWVGPANAPDADSWLAANPKQQGSWWESWARWCADRSGQKIEAPKKLGCKEYSPTVDAPGDYVRL